MKRLDQFLEIFHSHGYQAYGVGGCVRDYLLNLEINDYDVATNATPQQMIDLFKDYQLSTVGSRFGTIGIYYQQQWFECTTYRVESDYSDGRHPSFVKQTKNLNEDLSRRDFTINAMAYVKGEIIDLFNGQQDLKNRIIRTVHNPIDRFNEDALRILRAFRLASKLNFNIEAQTLQAIKDTYPLIDNLSKERVTSEMIGMIMGQSYNQVILNYQDVLEQIFKCRFLPIEHQKSFEARFVASSKNCDIDQLLNHFSFSKQKTEAIIKIAQFKDYQFNKIDFLKFMSKNSTYIVDRMVDFHQLSFQIDPTEIVGLSDLAIDGYDLIELDIKPKDRARLLNTLLDLVIQQTLNNDRDELIDFIKNDWNL